MSAVTLKNIGGVDLTIGDREFVVVTGPAGSGSSAIIRMIAGLAEIAKGDLLFDERRINDVAPKDRDVALLAPDYTPYPGMTVSENLAIGLQRREFGSPEIKKRIESVAETLGLQDQLSAKPESLSPEQRRFVGLARAMVRQPKLYLFDEPFADLEPAAANRRRAAIAALRLRASSTILYATSDPVEALAFGARTVIFEDGVVQQDADAQAIFDEPANLFVAKFFGDPPMNLVHGALKQDATPLFLPKRVMERSPSVGRPRVLPAGRHRPVARWCWGSVRRLSRSRPLPGRGIVPQPPSGPWWIERSQRALRQTFIFGPGLTI